MSQLEFRVIFEAKNGTFWATQLPITEDQALGHALNLKKSLFDPSTGQEIERIGLEERQVIDGAPQAWKRYGTHQGGRS